MNVSLEQNFNGIRYFRLHHITKTQYQVMITNCENEDKLCKERIKWMKDRKKDGRGSGRGRGRGEGWEAEEEEGGWRGRRGEKKIEK